MLARNTFGGFVDYFPAAFAGYVRLVIFSSLLAYLALNLKFRGLGPLPVLLGLLPSRAEVFVIAALARAFFPRMPTIFSYMVGCLLAVAGSAGNFPMLYNIRSRGFLIRDVIQRLLIVGTAIDMLVLLTIFNDLKIIFTAQLQ